MAINVYHLIVLNALVTLLHGCSLPKMVACKQKGKSVACSLTGEKINQLENIPSCVEELKITFNPNDPNILVADLFQSLHHLRSLVELNLMMNGRVLDIGPLTSSHLIHFNNLTALRIRGIVSVNVERDTFSPLTKLRLLDLTGTVQISLNNIAHGVKEMSKAPVHTLILKNTQQIVVEAVRLYNLSIDLSLIICPVKESLRVLDLSYNDIVHITGTHICFSDLHDLDLSHNLLASIGGVGGRRIRFLGWVSIFQSLENLKVGPNWQVGSYQNDILSVDDETTAVEVIPSHHDSPKKNSLLEMLENISDEMSVSPTYAHTVQDILVKNCKIPMLTVVQCLPKLFNTVDFCEFFRCIFPDLKDSDIEACYDSPNRFLTEIFRPICNYKHCFFGAEIPITPTIKHVDVSHFSIIPIIMRLYFDDETTTLCIHPNNQLTSIDISNNAIQVNEPHKWANIGIKGLNKLKTINAKDLRIPLLRNPHLLHNMPELEEVDLSGSSFLEEGNQTLPGSSLQYNENLKIVKMSRLNIMNIEHDAFVNNYKLEYLDLAMNNLSSNIYFNVSATSVSFLNLSHNKIGFFRADFISNLNQKVPLVVDLSNNPLLCNCETLDFISWIQNTDVNFTRLDSYQCIDASFIAIVNFDVSAKRLQCQRWREPVIAVLSALLVVFLVASVAFMYKKRWRIHTWWFRVVVYFKQPREDCEARLYKAQDAYTDTTYKQYVMWHEVANTSEHETLEFEIA